LNKSTKKLTLIGLAALLAPAILIGVSRASDHADTPDIAANPGTDITDVYVFPSPSNNKNVVMVMNVHPLIASGQGPSTSFDPNVLYQFKIDTNGDGVEDKVIQVKFTGTGSNQQYQVSLPEKPSTTGTSNQLEDLLTPKGTINQTFSPNPQMKVFAGAREDPFFFDLNQFFTIFPDRATPISGVPVANPNTPQAGGWRAPGVAQDFLSVNHFNVLSIVIELPRRFLQ
jgi:hypothetical protein